MIVFDLACRDGRHVFEIWFGSTADYEEQKARGLISCPYCGSVDVDKAVMAPHVGAKGNSRSDPAPAAPTASVPANIPAAANVPTPTQFKEMMAKLAEVQVKMLEKSDYVGTRFAEEARSMHLGEQDVRPIYGQTTAEEARALVDEGVPVAPLLVPITPPKDRN